jgi:hypothetical protein
MPLIKKLGPEGTYFVRPPFQPADYTPDGNDLSPIESYRGYPGDTLTLLADREGPFVGFQKINDTHHSGKRWLTLLNPYRDFAIDVEVVSVGGFGELRILSPEQAYAISCEYDTRRKGQKVVNV